MRQAASGIVYLVGAGPGDPALITVRGAKLLRRAEVVVYDGLANPMLLDLVPAEAVRVYAGKKRALDGDGQPLTQADIHRVLIEHGRAGKRVVRLKGGDPFVFGRGAEECSALYEAGVRFEVVPGVTSATAVPAYAGIPLTARLAASTVAFATGHEAAGKPDSDIDWQALARAGTVVLFMALRTVAECAERLMAAGRPPETPAAAIYRGTTARQRSVVATLSTLAEAVAEAGLRPPALLVIGEVVGLRDELAWYERLPLFGLRVLIPRAQSQAQGFADMLSELGAEPVIMPLTRTAPPTDQDRAVMDQAVASLASYHWLLFTSANAVDSFLDALLGRGRDLRSLSRCQIACVGASTAGALAARGLLADLVPTGGNAKATAEALLAAARASASHGAAADALRVLFPRAAEGRDEAVHVLQQAGARVDVVPVYRTEPTPTSHPMVRRGAALLRARTIDAIAFFAPSQVDALFDLLGEPAQELVSACAVIAAIGNTTKAALTKRGVNVDLVPSSPDSLELAEKLAAIFAARRSKET